MFKKMRKGRRAGRWLRRRPVGVLRRRPMILQPGRIPIGKEVGPGGKVRIEMNRDDMQELLRVVWSAATPHDAAPFYSGRPEERAYRALHDALRDAGYGITAPAG